MQRPAKPFTPVRFRIQPPFIMKIGIIGYGFVGKALNSALSSNVDTYIVDPKLNTYLDDLKDFKPNAIFICLPTPMLNDGTQDISIVKDAFQKIKQANIDGIIVVKSTIHPGNIKELESIFSNFIYNPEFLREKHANEDFINSNLIIFGGDNESAKILSEIYSNHTMCVNKEYVYTDAITASLIKYTINSFLATKVIFFNEINSLFKLANAEDSWENFVNILSKDKRIGDSHMMVPGHDGRYGFGGACFPKDINALLMYAESIKAELGLIKNVIKTNNKIRASYNSVTDREDEQNINYTNIKEE